MNESEYRRYGLLADAAELYYIRGLQQAEIAERMKISRSLVSRLISEAQAKGIVSISINRFFERNTELESELSSRFGDTEVCVLRLPGSLDSGDRKRRLAQFAADIIHTGLPQAGLLGFSFGTTLLELVEALAIKSPAEVDCVQLTGSLGASGAAFDGHQLVQKLAAAWNRRALYLHAPFLVKSEEMRRELFLSRSNRENAAACSRLDAVVVGLSPLGTSRPEPGCSSALLAGGHITAEDVELMRSRGVVGDIGAYSVDADGRPAGDDSLVRMIGVDAAAFRAIPLRYGIAAGEHKREIVSAALKGGWFSTLFLDEAAASGLAGDSRRAAAQG